MADPIVSNLSAYAGKKRNEIIGQVFREMESVGVTVLTGIKGEQKFPKLSVAKGLKPYTGTYSPADVLDLTDRAISPKLAQFDLLIEPLKLHNTWYTEEQKKNAVEAKLPFEAFAMQSLVKRIADELIASTIGLGDTTFVGSDNARKVCDGFLKRIVQIIAAGNTTIATGAIDDTNAVEKLEGMYVSAMGTNSAWRSKDIRTYVSWATFQDYITNYRAEFTQDPANWSDGGRKIFLKNSYGKCEIYPADWMGTSARVIMAPVSNMIIGTDALSDMNNIKMVEDVYTTKVGVTLAIDTQIVDREAVWFNDQA